MNARFRSGFITIIHRLPGAQKFCAKRLRGTNRYPKNGESIFLALNHQSYINNNKNLNAHEITEYDNKKPQSVTNRIVKTNDYFDDDNGINGTD